MAAKNSLLKNQLDEAVIVARLKNRADFLKARNGARSHERAFVLQLVKRDETETHDLRVGFTVTKKIGNAVVRNRIKRRLREAVKQAEIPKTVAGHDAVLIARIEALDIPFQDLVKSISHSLVSTKKPRQKRK
jgi:ribonuclease P protein component